MAFKWALLHCSCLLHIWIEILTKSSNFFYFSKIWSNTDLGFFWFKEMWEICFITELNEKYLKYRERSIMVRWSIVEMVYESTFWWMKTKAFSSRPLLTCLPSGVRWHPCPPEEGIPRQTIVPHHYGSHRRGRSLLFGGSLHGSPAQEVTKNKQNTCCFLSTRFLKHHLGLWVSISTVWKWLSEQWCNIIEMMCVLYQKMFKLINFNGEKRVLLAFLFFFLSPKLTSTNLEPEPFCEAEWK